MADFAELLASLVNPGEDGPSPSIYDDLSASYTEATSTRDAKIGVVSEELEALKLELLAAKAANWDLMNSLPVAESEDSGDNEDDTDNSEDDSEDDPDSDFFDKED